MADMEHSLALVPPHLWRALPELNEVQESSVTAGSMQMEGVPTGLHTSSLSTTLWIALASATTCASNKAQETLGDGHQGPIGTMRGPTLPAERNTLLCRGVLLRLQACALLRATRSPWEYCVQTAAFTYSPASTLPQSHRAMRGFPEEELQKDREKNLSAPTDSSPQGLADPRETLDT